MSSEVDPVHGQEATRWGGWSWRDPKDGEHFRRCSYCGSIHPEDLAAETEWRADWADRKYGWPHKFYSNIPNRDPGRRFIVASTNSPEPPSLLVGDEWIRGSAVPDDVDTDGYANLGEMWVTLGTRESHFAKFYTVHLADPAADQPALEAIQRVSGLRFQFEDGRVSWGPLVDPEGGTP